MLATQFNVEALHILLAQPVSTDMISHLAAAASGMVDGGPELALGLPRLPSFEEFISHLSAQPEITTPIIMSALVYLERLKRKMVPLKRPHSAGYRLFLAALVLSFKYNNDVQYTIRAWSEMSCMLTQNHAFWLDCDTIKTTERQVLRLLGWDLSISEEALLHELEPLLAPIRQQLLRRQAWRLV
ncbi:hypothetical protein B0T11DRAFT_353864 [Plectosphaerella cucumerina]|uniref:Cyclin N-terminal domain-containing protein n=1 Tax=Plectosphaerella cucumerina TaxID=40658 RepID=A0A8K0X4U1_9PEZI|nr:hypothetical protein B0T11DRAFT_353864 [Plectosphaerella cucumerina]